MYEILAHITEFELPSFAIAVLMGFVSGVAVTWAVMARRMK
jgi:hypothetical protein